jgi:hypothetical protein
MPPEVFEPAAGEMPQITSYIKLPPAEVTYDLRSINVEVF